MRIRTIVGLLVILLGIIGILFGIYNIFTTPLSEENVQMIARNIFLPIIVGVIVVINGVVIQGFKNIYALIVHLAANFFYYLAIQRLFSVAVTSATAPETYLYETWSLWIPGVVVNIIGIVLNAVIRKKPVEPKIRTCPQCGFEVPSDAKVCDNCGRKL